MNYTDIKMVGIFSLFWTQSKCIRTRKCKFNLSTSKKNSSNDTIQKWWIWWCRHCSSIHFALNNICLEKNHIYQSKYCEIQDLIKTQSLCKSSSVTKLTCDKIYEHYAQIQNILIWEWTHAVISVNMCWLY